MARKKIVAGNWKMNMTPSQAVKLVEELKPLVVSDDVEVVYCVPAIDIVPVVEAVKGTNVAVGAENKMCIRDRCKERSGRPQGKCDGQTVDVWISGQAGCNFVG